MPIATTTTASAGVLGGAYCCVVEASGAWRWLFNFRLSRGSLTVFASFLPCFRMSRTVFTVSTKCVFRLCFQWQQPAPLLLRYHPTHDTSSIQCLTLLLLTPTDSYKQQWSQIDFNNGSYDPCGGWAKNNSRFTWAALSLQGRKDRLRAFIEHQQDQAKAERRREQSRRTSQRHRDKKKATLASVPTITPVSKPSRGRPATDYRPNTPLAKSDAISPPGTTIGPGASDALTQQDIINMFGQAAANQKEQAAQFAQQSQYTNSAIDVLVAGQQQQQAINANVQRRLNVHGRLQARHHQEFQQFKAKVSRHLGASFDEQA